MENFSTPYGNVEPFVTFSESGYTTHPHSKALTVHQDFTTVDSVDVATNYTVNGGEVTGTGGAVQFVPIRGGGGSGGGSSGGGSSSHSGSSGSNSSYSSGGGGSIGGLFGIILILAFFGVFGLVIFGFIRRARKGNVSIGDMLSSGGNTLWETGAGGANTVAGLAMMDPVENVNVPEQLTANYTALVTEDPDFTMVSFDDSARRVFYAVQTAWCECQPGLTRKVMADRLWQTHSQQINRYVTAGTHNQLDGLAVQYTTVQQIATAQGFEMVTVRFFVDSADYDVDEKGKVVRGDKMVRSWCEDWTFARSESATTVVKGIAQDTCPNCGAGLDVDTLGNCNYCHAAIMGGAHDWVLSDITQLSSLEEGWRTRGVLPSVLDGQNRNPGSL